MLTNNEITADLRKIRQTIIDSLGGTNFNHCRERHPSVAAVDVLLRKLEAESEQPQPAYCSACGEMNRQQQGRSLPEVVEVEILSHYGLSAKPTPPTTILIRECDDFESKRKRQEQISAAVFVG